MIRLGKWNKLRIVRFTDHGAYLDSGETGEILMPKAYVRPEMTAGDEVRVFVYLDQSERLVGTTEQPFACVGQFAALRVAWVNEHGAFLDWGLMKDLFVPFREQKTKMQQGETHVVYIYVDEESRRIVGSAKVEHWLSPATPDIYSRGSDVEIIVQQRTPLGYKVIVDNAYAGIIYGDQIFGSQPRIGDNLRGTVVQVRPDGKLDISLDRIGTRRFRDFADVLLDELKAAGGSLPYSDDSTPEEIAQRFSVSKKTFKRAVGTLYRNKKIELLDKGIRLVRRQNAANYRP